MTSRQRMSEMRQAARRWLYSSALASGRHSDEFDGFGVINRTERFPGLGGEEKLFVGSHLMLREKK